MQRPETRYAKAAGDVHIAYQVVGDGPDLLLAQGWVTNVELAWDVAAYGDGLRRLARFSRLIVFDKRGVGLSDRGVGHPSFEERCDDVRAVLDAVGSEAAHVLGESEGGPMTIQLAATRPERVRSLVLYGTFARQVRSDDYPAGLPQELLDRVADQVEEVWGTPASLELFSRWSGEVDAEAAEASLRWCRQSASPREAAEALRRNGLIDVRSALSAITAPTLVLHRRDDSIVPMSAGQFLAQHIAGARFAALPGGEHEFFAGDTEPLFGAVEEWVTGDRPAPVAADRVLAAVLFTDIVGSTELASSLGDARWRRVLDDHDQLVARQVERFAGHMVKSTGDGALATFDGPGRAVRCAQAIASGAIAFGLEVRAGVHAGEIERRGDDVGGIAVHIGARVAGLAAPGQVLVTATVRDLTAGSDLVFEEIGHYELKGVPGTFVLLSPAS